MLKELKKLQMAYAVLVFYAVLTIATSTLGYKMDNKNGFTKGYLAGTAISLALWFQVGKKYSKL